MGNFMGSLLTTILLWATVFVPALIAYLVGGHTGLLYFLSAMTIIRLGFFLAKHTPGIWKKKEL